MSITRFWRPKWVLTFLEKLFIQSAHNTWVQEKIVADRKMEEYILLILSSSYHSTVDSFGSWCRLTSEDGCAAAFERKKLVPICWIDGRKEVSSFDTPPALLLKQQLWFPTWFKLVQVHWLVREVSLVFQHFNCNHFSLCNFSISINN